MVGVWVVCNNVYIGGMCQSNTYMNVKVFYQHLAVYPPAVHTAPISSSGKRCTQAAGHPHYVKESVIK